LPLFVSWKWKKIEIIGRKGKQGQNMVERRRFSAIFDKMKREN
jgi:hypothetical protein